MKKITLLLVVLVIGLCQVVAQRYMEKLDRGLIAVKVSPGVYLSWRIPGEEWYDVTYNVYRDGIKLNTEPLLVSNFSDTSGTLSNTYTVSAIVGGLEQVPCSPVSVWANQYLEIPMTSRPAGYQVNDATAADLDGDGQMEIIVKRTFEDWTVAATNFAYFEAYKLDGTLLWSINVGPNIMSSSSVEINIAAFDFDEDGKAEVFLRTSEGTIFGDGTPILDTNGDGVTNYRYSVTQSANMQYMCAGPEFLSLVDGTNGRELDRIAFIPRGAVSDWGDNYGHRANKFFFGAPYLDGKHPSLFIGRGIYTKTEMRTYDIVNKKMVLRWSWSSGNSGPYFGQGNHNYTVADVDQDGRDEIVWGSMTIDDNGTGLYSTEFGHGDALHVGDMDPYRKGTEIFKCIEDSPQWGTAFYDGATGKVWVHHFTTYDCGRACAAKISDNIKGKGLWGGNRLYSASQLEQVGNTGGPENYRIYWDGDLCEEMTDHIDFTTGKGYGTGAIYKYQGNNSSSAVFIASGATSCNYTKGTPTLQADILGDWREEVIWRREDNAAIRIYTTINPTVYRNYALLHDHQYRQAVCWQMCGYNQPPHVSYYLGAGENIVVPPPPAITNNRLVFQGGGIWDKTSTSWLLNGSPVNYSDGSHVLLDVTNGMDVNLSLSEAVSPSVLTINSPGNYSLSVGGAGSLGGTMKLIKQGKGSFTFNGNHYYSGKTEVWNGRVNFSGNLSGSAVWLNLFGELALDGYLGNGLTMRYGSNLLVGGDNQSGSVTISGLVSCEENSVITFDLYSPSSNQNDVFTVNGDFSFQDGQIFSIVPHLEQGVVRLEAGEYTLMTVSGTITGDISKSVVKGIDGTYYSLVVNGNRVVLIVHPFRNADQLVWDGALSNGKWDLAITQNFLNNSVADVFVTGDTVVFNDASTSKVVNIAEVLMPHTIIVESASNYTFAGNGSIDGQCRLTKKGSGKLTIANNNGLTGKITISEGTLEVSEMPSKVGDGLNPLGAVSSVNNNLELNGGTLSIIGECIADRAAYIGDNGGTIHNTSTLLWNGTITGGTLTKSGGGNLRIAGTNSNSKTIITFASLISLFDEDAKPGQLVSFDGGTLQCYDNSYTYSSSNVSFEVLAGKTGTLRLDSRCNYTGALTGEGTLNVYIPYTRSDLAGNWSAFAGTLNFYSSSGSGVDFRVANSNGYPNAIVNLGDNVYGYHLSGSTVRLGALTGTGIISGDHLWEIGSRNTDFTFSGTFTAGTLNKVGTGTMTIPVGNTMGGVVSIKGGGIVATNTSGSATGTGAVIIYNGAFLSGNGILTSAVNVLSGGTLYAGHTSTGSTLSVKSVSMAAGSVYYVKTNTLFGYADKITATNSFAANGQLVLNKTNPKEYAVGDSFQIVSAPTITGTFASISPDTPGAGMAWDLSEFNTSGRIKVVASTAVDPGAKAESLSLYPNPSNGVVRVNVPEGMGEAIVQVETLNGQVVLNQISQELANHEIDLSGLEKGIYIVRVTFEKRVLLGKVILR